MNQGCAEFVRKGGDRHLLYFHQFDSIKKEIFIMQEKEGRKEGRKESRKESGKIRKQN